MVKLATVDIEEYIKLYNKGLTMDDIEPLKNQTYKIFKVSKKADVRIIDRTLTYSNPNAFAKIKYFVQSNPYFYMIPMKTINETIVGFILRGVTKSEYSTITKEFSEYKKKVPFMFGFDSTFKKLDESEKCYPIVVCEGCKDCMVLKKYYPFVVANNTSSMGLNSVILRNMSDKFILAYDNDSAGQEGMDKDSKILRQSGAFVQRLSLDKEFKDCADYVGHPEKLKGLIHQLKSKVKVLYKSNW